VLGEGDAKSAKALALALGVASVWLAMGSSARAQPQVVLPECGELAHLDLPLLAQLLAVELTGEVTVTLDAGLCDAEATHVELTMTTTERTEREPVPVLGDEPAGRARNLALVIAERVHLLLLQANVNDVPATNDGSSDERAGAGTDEPAPTPAPASVEVEVPDGSELEVSDLPDAPRSMFTPPMDPVTPRAPPRPIALPPTVEVVALARLAPISPSGAIGVRSEVHAHLDRYWSLSIGIAATWSHAQIPELSPQVLIGALSGSVGWTPYRDHTFDMVIAARGEIGAALVGGQGVDETALPWATLGADAALLLWPHPSLGLILEMGVSGVIAGTGIRSRLGEPILQLTGVVLDLTLGFRVPLE
jgi:hypothetical protein